MQIFLPEMQVAKGLKKNMYRMFDNERETHWKNVKYFKINILQKIPTPALQPSVQENSPFRYFFTYHLGTDMPNPKKNLGETSA